MTKDPTKRERKKPSSKKADTAIIVALIALIGTVVTALFNSPVITALIQQTPNQAQIVLSPAFPSSESTETLIPQTKEPTNIETITPTSTIEQSNAGLPSATQNSNLVMPGTYLVGKDIQPGIYRGETGYDVLDACYWARLRNLSGGTEAIIAIKNSIGQFYIEIQDGDHAIETRCELVPLNAIPPPTGEFPQAIKPGMYLVGMDIQTGTYRGQAGNDIASSCHWERLEDVSGDLSSIITNHSAVGQFYIQVIEGDFALFTKCELERIGD